MFLEWGWSELEQLARARGSLGFERKRRFRLFDGLGGQDVLGILFWNTADGMRFFVLTWQFNFWLMVDTVDGTSLIVLIRGGFSKKNTFGGVKDLSLRLKHNLGLAALDGYHCGLRALMDNKCNALNGFRGLIVGFGKFHSPIFRMALDDLIL